MQFSESWLRTFVDPPLATDELCHLLTMAGLEVEETRSVAPAFSNVVVGHVLSVEKHPDADKLKLCKVDTGEHGVLQIVCGAPNVAVAMRVPCALVGAVLPGMEIKKAKVRGIESHGMLCSSRELGLTEDHGGLLALPADAPVGQDIRHFLDLDDTLITIKLTPNRADCLSLLGVAREVSALTGSPLKRADDVVVTALHDESRAVVLDAPDACPRYCGRIIRGVNAAASTPAWMRQRIERCGLRSISALVDVTNYVMMELGQPLHAFDNARLSGAIHVRYPQPGEQLLLLNEQTVHPAADTALITDEDKPLAMAGVMGANTAGITLETRDLFLESAFFPPDVIAGKARALGFSSDASYRYERGVDFALQRTALERATRLILDICGGEPGPLTEAVSAPHLPTRPAVTLRTERVARVLGMRLEADQIRRLLVGLGLTCEVSGGDFQVTPPSYRFDLAIEEDLIEELARLHGYDNIPSPPPRARLSMLPQAEARRPVRDIRKLLAASGFHEVVNFSFVDAAWERDFAGNLAPVQLANPIASQMGVMRSTLIGGLIANLATNRSRQVDRVRVFEIGRCFLKSQETKGVAGFAQPLRVAALCAGSALPEQWGADNRAVDFFDVKADVEALLAPQKASFDRCEHPALHPGRCARVSVDGESIGVIGEIHPRWVQQYELATAPVVFELDLATLLRRQIPAYQETSRFPAVMRDLALVVDHSVKAQDLLDVFCAQNLAMVRHIDLFDVYQGKGVAEGMKSLAFRIVMQDTQRTLAEVEVEEALGKLLNAAKEGFSAVLRT